MMVNLDAELREIAIENFITWGENMGNGDLIVIRREQDIFFIDVVVDKGKDIEDGEFYIQAENFKQALVAFPHICKAPHSNVNHSKPTTPETTQRLSGGLIQDIGEGHNDNGC